MGGFYGDKNGNLLATTGEVTMPLETDLALTETGIDDLLHLARNAGSLPSLIAAASEIGPQSSLRVLSRQVAAKTGMQIRDVRRLVGSLLNLHDTIVDLKIDTDETLQAITESITRASRDDLQIWQQARDQIAAAIRQLNPDHVLVATQKVGRIRRSHDHLLVASRVITDIRPIFNDAGDKIVQSVITHVLSIDYHDGPEHRQIQFALDSEDIADLKRICQRAEQKALVAKSDLSKVWPTTIYPEES